MPMIFFRRLYCICLVLTASSFAVSKTTDTVPVPIIDESRAAPVVLDKDTVFWVRTGIGSLTPQERAQAIENHLEALRDTPVYSRGSLRVEQAGTTWIIQYHDMKVASITETDAALEGKQPEVLASQLKKRIQVKLDKARRASNLWGLIRHISWAVFVLVLLAMAEYLVSRFFGRAKKRISQWAAQGKLPTLRIQKSTLLTQERSLGMINGSLRVVTIAIQVALAYIALLILFGLFSWTQDLGGQLVSWTFSPFVTAARGILNFIPDLIHIIVIVFIAHLFLKLMRFLVREIELGNLVIPGFYADWAVPTFNISRFILYAFVLVVIFPYLPGSDSPVFRGVSVFLGLLLSLGSSSAFSNVVAGLVLTYMRPFKLGDRIQVGEVTGDVIEKTLLVTRLRTVYNETVTVPNAALLAGNITNYSITAAEKNLLLNTSVTIGYDVPWRKVHALLLDAAARSEGILKHPEPFVVQKSLDDFYVCYELNAATDQAPLMRRIYSELHQNIQDSFFGAGVEIMSPHYRALRDGNAVTIPTKETTRTTDSKTQDE